MTRLTREVCLEEMTFEINLIGGRRKEKTFKIGWHKQVF